jgi:hypothetical protein
MPLANAELTKATLHKKTVAAFEALHPFLNSSTVHCR